MKENSKEKVILRIKKSSIKVDDFNYFPTASAWKKSRLGGRRIYISLPSAIPQIQSFAYCYI